MSVVARGNVQGLLNDDQFQISLPRSGLCFQAIRTLSGIPAFVILFSARTRAIASAT
jgi:hypothetical protein